MPVPRPVSLAATDNPIHPDLLDALQTANSQSKLLLVDFYGAWCPWCVKMDGTLEDPDVKAVMNSSFYYDKLDVGRFDQHTECLKQYGVDGIPFIAVFRADGSLLKSNSGYMEPADFVKFLNDALAQAAIKGSHSPRLALRTEYRQRKRQDAPGGFLRRVVPVVCEDGRHAGGPGRESAMNSSFYYDKLDVGRFDQHIECLKQYGVDGIPFIAVFHPDGTLMDSISGYQDAQTFTATLKKWQQKTGMTTYKLADFTSNDQVLEAIKKAGDANQRLLVYFYENGETNDAFEKVFTQVNDSDLASHFAILRIPLKDNSTLGAHYGCTAAPFLILFKRNGDTSISIRISSRSTIYRPRCGKYSINRRGIRKKLLVIF